MGSDTGSRMSQSHSRWGEGLARVWRLGARGRLFLLSVAFLTVVFVAVGLLLEHQLRDALEERIEDDLGRQAAAAAEVLTLSSALDEGTAATVANRLGASFASRVTVIDAQGVVQGDSEVADLSQLDNHGSRAEVVAAREAGKGLARRHSDTLRTDMLYVAVRVDDDGNVVRASVPLVQIEEEVATLRRLLLQIGGLSLLVLAVLVAFISHRLTRSWQSLVATAEAMARAEPGVRIPEPPTRELSGLAGSFNAMATQLEQTMTTLARERVRFEAALETMDQAVISLDEKQRIITTNRAARALVDLPPNATGRPLLECLRVPALQDLVTRTERENAASIEFDYGMLPRKRIVASGTTQPGGGVVMVLHDITEIRRLERVRQDFIANVSHELRTPVAVIQANTETLLAGAAKDPERARVFIDALHRHAERLGRLVSDLLDISRIEAGRYELEVGPREVGLAIDGVTAQLEQEAERKNITVARVFEGDAWVRADDKALEQVLVNLVSNAIKYSDEGARVEVSLREDGDMVRIEVLDDGPGLDPKHHHRVFERFYRVDKGRTRHQGGTGLGLAIVKHLVEAMGGHVGVSPRRPRGSVFWFELSRAESIDEPETIELIADRAEAANS